MTLPDARQAIHAALTGVMAWLGIFLALPLNSFGTSRVWNLMAQMGSEEQWAMALWLAASFGFVGLFTHIRSMQIASVLVLASAHGGLAGLFVLSAPASPGGGLYAILAMLGYYLLWLRVRG